jgi:hypothetical protein
VKLLIKHRKVIMFYGLQIIAIHPSSWQNGFIFVQVRTGLEYKFYPEAQWSFSTATKSCFPMTRKGVHIVCIPRLRENVKCKFLQHLLPFIWKNMETVVASSHWAPDAWLWCLVWPTRAAKFDLHPNNLPELACGPWNYRYFIESDLAFLETCSSDCICQGGRRKVFVL